MTPVEHRFWSRVEKTGTCWIWHGAKDKDGYGRFKIAGKMVLTHRFSFELAKGEIPVGHMVMHTCDNPPCVFPGHLVAGTGKKNMEDCVARGRIARGSKQGSAKFTEAQVRVIRQRVVDGETQLSISREFGVTVGAVNHIILRRNWGHLQ